MCSREKAQWDLLILSVTYLGNVIELDACGGYRLPEGGIVCLLVYIRRERVGLSIEVSRLV